MRSQWKFSNNLHCGFSTLRLPGLGLFVAVEVLEQLTLRVVGAVRCGIRGGRSQWKFSNNLHCGPLSQPSQGVRVTRSQWKFSNNLHCGDWPINIGCSSCSTRCKPGWDVSQWKFSNNLHCGIPPAERIIARLEVAVEVLEQLTLRED